MKLLSSIFCHLQHSSHKTGVPCFSYHLCIKDVGSLFITTKSYGCKKNLRAMPKVETFRKWFSRYNSSIMKQMLIKDHICFLNEILLILSPSHFVLGQFYCIQFFVFCVSKHYFPICLTYQIDWTPRFCFSVFQQTSLLKSYWSQGALCLSKKLFFFMGFEILQPAKESYPLRWLILMYL